MVWSSHRLSFCASWSCPPHARLASLLAISMRCHLGLVLFAYTWTPEDSSLAAEGCASSSGCQLVDREPGRSSRAGVDFWSLVEL
ncbi:hypothetical protein B296_00044061 [Ensete ventricosum]|uniref:Uncharacterized protein n=1 Tax=Ensete ventricosum TaxID=4639 RepID=A0A426XFD2_ENSVE|nr:hypothetical protein B296_00044061 [Ensete ventricosum]